MRNKFNTFVKKKKKNNYVFNKNKLKLFPKDFIFIFLIKFKFFLQYLLSNPAHTLLLLSLNSAVELEFCKILFNEVLELIYHNNPLMS